MPDGSYAAKTITWSWYASIRILARVDTPVLRCTKVWLRYLQRFQLSARKEGNRRQTRSDGIQLNGASAPSHQHRRNFECSFIWLKTNPCHGHGKPFALLSTSTTDGALDLIRWQPSNLHNQVSLLLLRKDTNSVPSWSNRRVDAKDLYTLTSVSRCL